MSRPESLEERIRKLEDHDEIRGLTHRYCDLVWRLGGAAIADLFTEDGVFQHYGRPEIRGRDAMTNYFAELPTRKNLAHPYIHNHVITVDGDSASGVCYIDNRQGDGTIMAGGYYEDEMRRTPSGWKFSRRCHHLVFQYTVKVRE